LERCNNYVSFSFVGDEGSQQSHLVPRLSKIKCVELQLKWFKILEK
jgi:hypothetical protein